MVNVEEYVPPAKLTAPKEPALVPPEYENATVSPPDVMEFPAASLGSRVTVAVALLPTVAEVAPLTRTCDWTALIGPGFTVRVAVELTAAPPMVALTVVAVPETTPVNVAVYAPPVNVIAPKLPVLVPPDRENTTVSPPLVMAFPELSRGVSVTETVLPALTLALAAPLTRRTD